MIYIKNNEYNSEKWDSLIKLIMFRAATLSKRSFIEEAVKCLLRVLVNAGVRVIGKPLASVHLLRFAVHTAG